MHHIYHTEGLILESRNIGESGKYYHIFTRDLGMIRASAQGVRTMESKLRYVLQDFSYIKIDLIESRDFWKITSASKSDILENLSKNQPAFMVFLRISKLLKRLLAGEDANSELFADVMQGMAVIERSEDANELQNMEAVMVLRILNNLGYIGGNEVLENLIRSPLELALVQEVSAKRRVILSEINKALKETDL
jgi:DNA repair protein RecO (recombination protein O)